MNIVYCDKQCPIGMEKSKELLAMHNSAYDAALDFCSFVDKCFKTCPYKEFHNGTDA
jgi:hypothetical protein